MTHGLVVGKFYPLHAGHSALIEHALDACDRVTVVLLANSTESIPVDVRHGWLEEVHPRARVVSSTADHAVDYADPAIWDLWEREIRALLDAPVDVVFSSEAYGAELARRLSARNEVVDPARRHVRVSGTAVRRDPAANWAFLAPAVRAWFVRRVAVVGAESTGTTTLARDIAQHYGAAWVPEYGREYASARAARDGTEPAWRSDEFLTIAEQQIANEDARARDTEVPLLVCDTDALATAIWHERYIGHPSTAVQRLVDPSRYCTYLVTRPDIPFEQDGTRDGEHVREWMHGRFVEELERLGATFRCVGGSPEVRLREACAIIDAVLGGGWQLAAPVTIPTDLPED